eukprot:10065292-Alexandrium_andersonii.AAC.1
MCIRDRCMCVCVYEGVRLHALGWLASPTELCVPVSDSQTWVRMRVDNLCLKALAVLAQFRCGKIWCGATCTRAGAV